MQNGITLQAVVNEPGRPSRWIDYGVLGAVILFGAYLVFFLSNTTLLKLEAMFIFILLYLLWGLLHHHKEQTLTWHIVADYFSLSAFLGIMLTVVLAVV